MTKHNPERTIAYWADRAEKAEQYREAWQAAESAVLDERAMRREAERDRDEARARLAGVTIAVPDVTITDEMVERARDVWEAAHGCEDIGVTLRRALTAALTEPPARPEWQDLADVLADIDPAETLSVADLAEEAWARGVRVTGSES